MEWLMTRGSLHLERLPQHDFDMGIWGGKSAAIFPVYKVHPKYADWRSEIVIFTQDYPRF